jgi:negative regulator of flagellin synthesis FlgM
MSYQNGINSLQQLFTQLNTSNTTQASPLNTNSGAGKVAADAPVASTTTNDQTSLSTLGGLAAQASQTDDVRVDKVSALQSAINSGTYNVPSSSVADSIINSLQS